VYLVVRLQSPGLVAGLAVSFVISAAPIPLNAREIVQFTSYPAGTVVVKTKERRLYYVLGDGKAIRYPVGVGRTGMEWSGMVPS
jgi:lipoprotein-anchoring transpeptidase ErfK/SrfK